MPLTSLEESQISLLVTNTVYSLYASDQADNLVRGFICEMEMIFWHALYAPQAIEIDVMNYSYRRLIRTVLQQELAYLEGIDPVFKAKLKKKIDCGLQEFEAGILALLTKTLSLDANYYRENLFAFYNTLMRGSMDEISHRSAFYFQLEPIKEHKDKHAKLISDLKKIFESNQSRFKEYRDKGWSYIIAFIVTCVLYAIFNSFNLEFSGFLPTNLPLFLTLFFISMFLAFCIRPPSFTTLKEFKPKVLWKPTNISLLHESKFSSHAGFKMFAEQIKELVVLIGSALDQAKTPQPKKIVLRVKEIFAASTVPELYELPSSQSHSRPRCITAIQSAPTLAESYKVQPASFIIAPRGEVVWHLALRRITVPALLIGARNLDDLSSGLPDGVSKIQSTDGAYLYGYIYIKPFAEITWYGKADQGLYDEFKRLAAMGSIVSVGAGNYNVGTGIKRMTSGQYEIVNKHAHYANFRMFSNTGAVHADAPYDRYYMIVFDTVGHGIGHS